MKEQQEAERLIDLFRKVGCRSFEEAEVNSAKQSAAICVKEIISAIHRIDGYAARDYKVESLKELNKVLEQINKP